MTPRAAIVGLAGHGLTAAEAALFRRLPPLGAILFARNIRDPAQLRGLCDDIRQELGAGAPILIDQEGGRVARLRPPHFAAFPPAGSFEAQPAAAAHANARSLGRMVRATGCNVVCAPVLDLRLRAAHGVIGDRAFSADPAEVARLGAAWAAGLREAGCVPVFKHLPGHGRALADSHLELPRVTASVPELAADLAGFAAAAGDAALGWGMTAHILYDAWDAALPATLSPTIIERVIRGAIDFRGLLLTDDLAMRALDGAPGALAAQALAAGCDVALHCTGEIAPTAAVLAASPPLTDAAAGRLAAARPPLAAAA